MPGILRVEVHLPQHHYEVHVIILSLFLRKSRFREPKKVGYGPTLNCNPISFYLI